MHVAWLAAAAALLASRRDAWSGTVLAVFQPGEETAPAPQAMVDDGLADRFPSPDVVLGQHVMPGPAAGTLTVPGGVSRPPTRRRPAVRPRRARLDARGRVDPVVMAAATVLRLQTVVSREARDERARRLHRRHAPGRHQGQRHPRRGLLGLNMRCYYEGVVREPSAAIRRIVAAEAEASGAPRPPEIT